MLHLRWPLNSRGAHRDRGSERKEDVKEVQVKLDGLEDKQVNKQEKKSDDVSTQREASNGSDKHKAEILKQQKAEIERIDLEFDKKTEEVASLINIDGFKNNMTEEYMESLFGRKQCEGEVVDGKKEKMQRAREQEQFTKVNVRNKVQPVIAKRKSSRISGNGDKVQTMAED